MPKIKTHSGAKKRFSLTKSGKVKRAMTKKRHLLNGHGKTTKLKRHLRGTAYVTEAVKPFKGNGVSSTMVSGGDLRARNGQKNGSAK